MHAGTPVFPAGFQSSQNGNLNGNGNGQGCAQAPLTGCDTASYLLQKLTHLPDGCLPCAKCPKLQCHCRMVPEMRHD